MSSRCDAAAARAAARALTRRACPRSGCGAELGATCDEEEEARGEPDMGAALLHGMCLSSPAKSPRPSATKRRRVADAPAAGACAASPVGLRSNKVLINGKEKVPRCCCCCC